MQPRREPIHIPEPKPIRRKDHGTIVRSEMEPSPRNNRIPTSIHTGRTIPNDRGYRKAENRGPYSEPKHTRIQGSQSIGHEDSAHHRRSGSLHSPQPEPRWRMYRQSSPAGQSRSFLGIASWIKNYIFQ